MQKDNLNFSHSVILFHGPMTAKSAIDNNPAARSASAHPKLVARHALQTSPAAESLNSARVGDSLSHSATDFEYARAVLLVFMPILCSTRWTLDRTRATFLPPIRQSIVYLSEPACLPLLLQLLISPTCSMSRWPESKEVRRRRPMPPPGCLLVFSAGFLLHWFVVGKQS